ncbi:acyltransferase [Coxiella burnetii]|uniref:acyltransferase n=1 Tax=Coxiella burnetii TaxID=777 RepID=UPI00051F1963|nr:acyltransferase [Coxiella burnetii]AIT62975.1 Bacterial transferase family (Hexapeptide motif) [Coxiella burnetii str. Namibia]
MSHIFDELDNAYKQKEAYLLDHWNRSLPFQDAMFDRWERAQRLGFGEDVSIYNSALVFGNVAVGANSWIGPYVILDGSGGRLSIGCYCSISAGVHIYTHDSVAWAVTGGKSLYQKGDVTIGNCCYIAPQSIIKMGIKIGDHSIIGANSFVNTNVPAYSIVAGSPAKVIGKVEIINDKVNLKYY